MRVLITGAGLVGTSYAIEAMALGDQCLFFDSNPDQDYLKMRLGSVSSDDYVQGDLRDLPSLISVMQKFQPSVVVHTAGLIGSSVSNPVYTGLQINIQGTINVLEAARLCGVQKFVHISTFGVYDRRLEGSSPLAEDFPRGADNPYSASKIANEHLAEAYAAQFGMQLVIVRPANVYGFGHFRGGSGGGRMLQSIVEAGLDEKELLITAAQARSFEYIHSDDLGRIIHRTVVNDVVGAFNAGNGTILTFDDLLESIKAVLPNLKVSVESGLRQSFAQPMDLSRAKSILEWEPTVSMIDGFKKYVSDVIAARAKMQ